MPISATRLSATDFAVATDLTARFVPGLRVCADCGQDGVLTGTVSASRYDAADALTTVTLTLDAGALTANLVSVAHGRVIPASLPRATSELFGAVRLASTEEALAGQDAFKAATPHGVLSLITMMVDSGALVRPFLLTPRHFGAQGNGVDDLAAIQAAIDYCGDTGRELLLDGHYHCNGGIVVANPISIRGMGQAGSKISLDIDNTEPGVSVLASNVTLHNITIEVTLSEDVMANRGDWGTCLTLGDFASTEEHQPVENINLENLRLVRSPVSQSGHAMVIVGRVRNVVGYNIEFSGGGSEAQHYSAMLLHWGYRGTTDADGVPTAIVETYHPSDISINGITVRDCIRTVYCSSVYNVAIAGIRQYGGYNVATIAVGDEGDFYACADDRGGKVCSNISIGDVIAWGISGTTEVNNVITVAGYGTSKVRVDTKTQNVFRNVAFRDWSVDADNSVEIFNVRNVVGDVAFLDWKSIGGFMADDATRINAGYFANCSGVFLIDNARIDGELNILDSDRVILTGGISNAGGTEPGNGCITITGRTFLSTLGADLAQGATSLVLSEGFYVVSGTSHVTDGATIKIGDTILYTANNKTYQVQATDYCDPGRTVVGITPAPVAAPAGASTELRKTARLFVERFVGESGRIGISAVSAVVRVRDSLFRAQGQYGMSVTDTELALDNVIFENGGQLRVSDSAVATRDLIVLPGGRVVARNCTFGQNASLIHTNVVTAAEAKGGALLDCVFKGTPISARTSFAVPTYGAFSLVRCVDATGAAVSS